MNGETPRSSLAQVFLFDVHQGDSILVRFSSGELIVVDCNIPIRSIEGEPLVLRELRRIAVETGKCDIEILCLTHTDADHYRGMTKIIDWVYANGGRVKNLILPSFPSTKDTKIALNVRKASLQHTSTVSAAIVPREVGKLHKEWNEYASLRGKLLEIQKEIRRRGRLFRTPSGFAEFWRTGDATRLYILGPTSGTVDVYGRRLVNDLIRAWAQNDNQQDISSNELSCILWLVVGTAAIMLTGDTTSAAWEEALNEYDRAFKPTVQRDTQSQLVKAPHHGARSSSKPELWSRVLAENAILAISAGNHSGYQHPHQDTLNDVLQARRDVRIYCTNVCPAHSQRTSSVIRVSLAEQSDADDDALLTGARQQLPGETSEYHGTCIFDIQNDGVIVARPQIENPQPTCLNHSYGGSATAMG